MVGQPGHLAGADDFTGPVALQSAVGALWGVPSAESLDGPASGTEKEETGGVEDGPGSGREISMAPSPDDCQRPHAWGRGGVKVLGRGSLEFMGVQSEVAPEAVVCRAAAE